MTKFIAVSHFKTALKVSIMANFALKCLFWNLLTSFMTSYHDTFFFEMAKYCFISPLAISASEYH